VKLPAVARRASWNLIDQMISSLTNAILSFMVARAVDPTTFGGFAVAFTVFTLVIGGARALCTAPLNIRFSDVDPAEQRRAAAAATGLSLLIAVVVGLGTVAAGLLLRGSTGEALLVMGLVLPAVIVQDSYRYVFFSRQTPAMAAVNDGVWAVLQIGSVAVLLSAGVSSVGPFVLVWGVAGAAAVLLALRQSATLPSPRRALGWLREQNDLTRYTFASWATQQGTMQGALLVIATIGTVVANGALRGAQILLGPATIISSSALTFAIPEFSRRRRTMTDRQWVLAACGVSAAVALLALCWGAIFLLMPDSVGEYLLNETWAGTRELLFAAVVGQVLACLTVGPVVMLYAIDRAKATFRIHLVLGTLVFLGGVGGVLLAGGPGAQWGFAIANGVVLPFWFVRLWRELKARAAAGPEPEDDDLRVGAVDAEATTVLAAPYRRPPGHYVHDLESAQMATMVLPRITPGGGRPGAPGRPPAAPPGVRPSPYPRSSRPGPGFRPPGPVPPGFAGPGPFRAAGPPPGPPGHPLPPRPPAGGDVAPDQRTRAHVLPPPPPPRPSPRPRPEPAAPADATATVVTPLPARSGAAPADAGPDTRGPGSPAPDAPTADAPDPGAAEGTALLGAAGGAGPHPAASGGADQATTVHHVLPRDRSGDDVPSSPPAAAPGAPVPDAPRGSSAGAPAGGPEREVPAADAPGPERSGADAGTPAGASPTRILPAAGGAAAGSAGERGPGADPGRATADGAVPRTAAADGGSSDGGSADGGSAGGAAAGAAPVGGSSAGSAPPASGSSGNGTPAGSSPAAVGPRATRPDDRPAASGAASGSAGGGPDGDRPEGARRPVDATVRVPAAAEDRSPSA
jgi:hypothetical protein